METCGNGKIMAALASRRTVGLLYHVMQDFDNPLSAILDDSLCVVQVSLTLSEIFLTWSIPVTPIGEAFGGDDRNKVLVAVVNNDCHAVNLLFLWTIIHCSNKIFAVPLHPNLQ